MEINNLKAKWKDMVAEDNIHELLQDLKEWLDPNAISYNEFIILVNQYNDLILTLPSKSKTGLKMQVQNPPNIIIYNTMDGKASVSLFAKDGQVWMNQNQIAELFDTSVPNINIHISNILKDKELDTIQLLRIT